MIVGLCGAQGSGKDTVANILVANYGFVRISFAAALKDVIAILFSWPRHMLEGDTPESRTWREAPDAEWSQKTGIPGFSPRKALRYRFDKTPYLYEFVDRYCGKTDCHDFVCES